MHADENHCPKKMSCKLWQVICDGKPCVVEVEVSATDVRRNIWSSK